MKRKCYKSQIFVPRLERALGIKAPAARCHVVDQAGMQKVMRAAGWNRQQSLGVVGFHRKVGGVNQIYVLDNSPWSTLHELIHAFGINSDQLSQFVAEGLTEAIAQENRKGADEHRPTYPTEHEWVTTRLLPMLGMSATELGRVLVRSRNQPRTLAQMVVKANPSLNEGQLRREFRSQNREKPSFNRYGSSYVTRPGPLRGPHLMGSSRYNLNRAPCPSPLTSVGFTLIGAGLLMIIPGLLSER